MTVLQGSQGVEKSKGRGSFPKEDYWDVEALYPSWDLWEEDLKRWGRGENVPRWPEIAKYRDSLSQGPAKVKELMDLCFTIDRHLSKLYTYAHLRHDEDVAEEVSKGAYARITSVLSAFAQEIAWIEPELLQLPEEKIEELLSSELLKEVRFHLEKVVRLKPHTLSADKEELLALAGKALGTSSQAFGAFNNADLRFLPIEDAEGKQHELTHGKYQLYLRGKDRDFAEECV